MSDNNKIRAIRINKFVKEESRVDWLVDTLVPNVGWSLLVGVKGIGKSTFTIQLCEALQDGKDFLGYKTRQTDILFIQADSPTREWQAILQRVAPATSGWTMVDMPNKALSNPTYVQQMASIIHQVNPGFVVFDSLYNLTAVPINTEAVLVPINTMKLICEDRPFLVIHHPPQGELRASGHNSLEANASNVFILMKTKLKIEKGRLLAIKEIYLTKDTKGLWVKDTETGDNSPQGGLYDMLKGIMA